MSAGSEEVDMDSILSPEFSDDGDDPFGLDVSAGAAGQPEAASAAAQDQAQEAPKPVERCGYCGWSHGSLNHEPISEDDKIEYQMSIIACRPFSKKYSALGGKVTLRFSTVNPVIEQRMVDCIEMCAQRREFDSGGVYDQERFRNRVLRWRLVTQLHALTINGHDINMKPTSWTEDHIMLFGLEAAKIMPADFDAAWRRITEALERPVMNLMTRTFAVFEDLCGRLDLAVCHPDF